MLSDDENSVDAGPKKEQVKKIESSASGTLEEDTNNWETNVESRAKQDAIIKKRL